MVPQSQHVALAWAAGFIDGEGCFYARAHKQKSDVYFSYQVTLTVANCNRAPLDKLRDLLGGNIQGPYQQAGNRKPHYHYSLGMRALRIALPHLIPYLVAKQSQANIALKLLERIHACKPWLRLTMQERESRTMLIDNIKALNHRGVVHGA